jgi:hypothetical protein
VATGDNFPDALAGGPVGAANDGPILLTGRDSLAPETAAELGRLQPDRVVVLGGPGAVYPLISPEAFLASLRQLRVSGGFIPEGTGPVKGKPSSVFVSWPLLERGRTPAGVKVEPAGGSRGRTTLRPVA